MGLERFLSSRDGIDTHLLLSASTKSADLARIVDAFEIFHPRRLLFTRLDETSSYGPIFNEAVRTGKPLSFFRNGPANSWRIWRLLRHGRLINGTPVGGPIHAPARSAA